MKKVRLILAVNLFVIVLCGNMFAANHLWTIPTVHAMSVSLAWDANIEPDLVGYFVYHGLPGMVYSDFIKHNDVGNVTTYTISDLAGGQTYRFVATAIDEYGSESDYSDEVRHDPSPLPATDLLDGNVSFSWTACPNDDVSEYRLYHKIHGATEWVSPALWSGSQTTCTVAFPEDGDFCTVVFDEIGQNSEDSNVVTINLPPDAVQGLTIISTTAINLLFIGPKYAMADLDFDGDVDGKDLCDFSEYYGDHK